MGAYIHTFIFLYTRISNREVITDATRTKVYLYIVYSSIKNISYYQRFSILSLLRVFEYKNYFLLLAFRYIKGFFIYVSYINIHIYIYYSKVFCFYGSLFIQFIKNTFFDIQVLSSRFGSFIYR